MAMINQYSGLTVLETHAPAISHGSAEGALQNIQHLYTSPVGFHLNFGQGIEA